MIDPQLEQAILDRVTKIPIWDTLRLKAEAFDDGYCRVSMPRDIAYDGIYGSIHGGIMMTVADSVACYAIMTRTGAGEPLTTTEMNIRFLAPCLTDLTAEARVIKVGRTLCSASVDMFDARGRKVAVAQVGYIRLSRPPKRTGKPVEGDQ